ncbi:alpha-n-arabinofuranosidase a [Diplodia corticola]|uniref:non-reducing end alpha-L-arabinofuranosidase n=1 Tax=Diplodia corticola TaxID=236234 RepID=A0A1J9RII1_9PEZI|nr:alpha-n-arabinofuranosidase a [Diplodia corticola]OJD40265.1 alpha-n-arabinofuranosidase a [Diplodia corticola]
MYRLVSAVTRVGAVAVLARHAAGINLTVSTSAGNATSPLMHGFMFEDINHSGDGGIHGQLLRNNGFQGDDQTTTAYGTVGDVELTVDAENPLSSAIPYSLAVAVPDGTTGDVGFSNEGYWGILVNADQYSTSFWIKGDYTGNVTIKLVGNYSGTEYASTTLDVSSNTSAYSYYETSFESEQAPNGNNLWTLTFDGESTAGSTLYFDLITLYPPTFNNRENGLKPAIANVLNDMGATFLRFPGGNNLEGYSEDNRWKWNETLGPLEDRPGRQGTWGYPNTDALGLIEYFEWCEDMGLAPILGVWDGFALESGGNTPITGDALTPYVDDVLNELEFILGDSSTTYGSLRASLGYPDPFTLTHVEIGNEDYLGTGVVQDYHTYASETDLVANFSQWDNANRSQPVFVGEFACYTLADGTHAALPSVACSVAEAVYMAGLERNADVVRMAAYAPLLQLVNDTQWTPDLVAFAQAPGQVVRSTSYFVQRMFAGAWGSETRAVEADGAFGPVYWSASGDGDGAAVYVKLANYGDVEQSVSVGVEGATSGALTTLSGERTAANSVEAGEVVVPVTSTLEGSDGTFEITLPAWSVAVLATS